jgi:hypothetical protein
MTGFKLQIAPFLSFFAEYPGISQASDHKVKYFRLVPNSLARAEIKIEVWFF